jgi:hypothetical protein
VNKVHAERDRVVVVEEEESFKANAVKEVDVENC